MLITTDELAARLTDPGWVAFDFRHDLKDAGKGERLDPEGTLPGARFAHVDVDLSGEKSGTNGRHPLPAPAAFTAFLARNGVSEGTTLVAYDDAGGSYAARLWWLARWIGLRKVVLLDGGLNKWLAEGRPLSREVPVGVPAPLRGHADPLMVLSTAEVESRLADPSMTLLDARAPERYRGEVEPIDPVAGHIPGALNRFFKNNVNADMTFKSAAALKAEFAALLGDVRPDGVVHQCGSGVTACANLFAMELAGLSGSKLYAGSWSEWVADGSRPVRTGGAA